MPGWGEDPGLKHIRKIAVHHRVSAWLNVKTEGLMTSYHMVQQQRLESRCKGSLPTVLGSEDQRRNRGPEVTGVLRWVLGFIFTAYTMLTAS